MSKPQNTARIDINDLLSWAIWADDFLRDVVLDKLPESRRAWAAQYLPQYVPLGLGAAFAAAASVKIVKWLRPSPSPVTEADLRRLLAEHLAQTPPPTATPPSKL